MINACTHNLASYSEDKLTVLGTVKLPVKFKTDVKHEVTFHQWKQINQDFWDSHYLASDMGLIKVVMAPKIDEKQAKPDQSEKATI